MSEISYTGSHPAHDWTGISSSFKGGIVCDSFDDCIIKIQIPINSFDSGNSSRDSNMLYYVEANKFKYVTFFLNHLALMMRHYQSEINLILKVLLIFMN